MPRHPPESGAALAVARPAAVAPLPETKRNRNELVALQEPSGIESHGRSPGMSAMWRGGPPAAGDAEVLRGLSPRVNSLLDAEDRPGSSLSWRAGQVQ